MNRQDMDAQLRDTYHAAKAAGMTDRGLVDMFIAGKTLGLEKTGYKCSSHGTTPNGAKMSIWQTKEGKTHIILCTDDPPRVVTFIPCEIYPPLDVPDPTVTIGNAGND